MDNKDLDRWREALAGEGRALYSALDSEEDLEGAVTVHVAESVERLIALSNEGYQGMSASSVEALKDRYRKMLGPERYAIWEARVLDRVKKEPEP